VCNILNEILIRLQINKPNIVFILKLILKSLRVNICLIRKLFIMVWKRRRFMAIAFQL